MLQTILVPLDGSELGEKAALPYVETLALALKAKVILLRVEPLAKGWSGGAFKAAASFLSDIRLPRSERDVEMSQHPIYKENEMASLEAEAKSALLPAAEHLRAKGIETEVAVVFGRPAGGILLYAESEKVDLIVMATHGEGGPTPWAFGPTADRVARRAAVPVMLIRPDEVNRMLPSLTKAESDDR
jgi:nucleotide-binding universal stress UspA family protein